MRLIITCLLVLVIGSMLVSTAFAECAAMNLPCCTRHHNTTCHEACASPAGYVSTATVPQPAHDLYTVSPAMPAALPGVSVPAVSPAFVPSAENLLIRIHVLLI